MCIPLDPKDKSEKEGDSGLSVVQNPKPVLGSTADIDDRLKVKYSDGFVEQDPKGPST